MIDWEHLGLAVIPPMLAIIVEFLNPINDHVLEASAEADLARFQIGQDHDVLVETAARSAGGAVEVAGLAPSLVSTISSGFAVVHDLPSPFWPAVCYILPFVAVILIILRLLGSRTFLEIETEPHVIEWRGRTIPIGRTRSQIVSWIIYAVNCLLISVAFIVYALIPTLGHYFSS